MKRAVALVAVLALTACTPPPAETSAPTELPTTTTTAPTTTTTAPTTTTDPDDPNDRHLSAREWVHARTGLVTFGVDWYDATDLDWAQTFAEGLCDFAEMSDDLRQFAAFMDLVIEQHDWDPEELGYLAGAIGAWTCADEFERMGL
jgi:hypothetical protein